MELFEKENWELVHYLDPTIVRSGSGLHIYVKIDTMDLTNKDNAQTWKHMMGNLNFLLRKWGADFKCIDTVRILRPPSTINRKAKYGREGKEVTLLRKSSARYSSDEAEQILDYLLQGGDRQIFQDVCDSLIQDIYFDGEDEEDFASDFIPIDFEDDIFTGVVPVPTTGIIPKSTDTELPQETGSIIEKPIIGSQKNTIPISVDCKFNDSYMGICVNYEDLPKYEFWQNRDMLFFIRNRSTTEGIRNNMLFFFGYNWYYFVGIRDFKSFQAKCLWLNKEYFKPSLPEKEILYHTAYLFKRLQNQTMTKYIRCQTLLKYIKVSDEEKAFARGNYYEKDTEEYIVKKKREKKRLNAKNYQQYKANKGKYNRDIKTDNAVDFIKANPYIPFSEAKDFVEVCQKIYYRLRKEVWKELGITKDDYIIPFIKNPDISFEEYHLLRGGTYNTFCKYKKQYLSLKQ